MIIFWNCWRALPVPSCGHWIHVLLSFLNLLEQSDWRFSSFVAVLFVIEFALMASLLVCESVKAKYSPPRINWHNPMRLLHTITMEIYSIDVVFHGSSFISCQLSCQKSGCHLNLLNFFSPEALCVGRVCGSCTLSCWLSSRAWRCIMCHKIRHGFSQLAWLEPNASSETLIYSHTEPMIKLCYYYVVAF